LRAVDPPVVLPHLDLVGMNGRRDILDLLLADVGELHRELVRHLLVHSA
jgi:hypothetical protein